MVQLAPRPPQRRFDTNPQAQRRPIQQPQSNRRPSRTRLLRYRLLILKVRIKVIFIKSKRRPLRSAGVVAVLTLLATAGFLIVPNKAKSLTDVGYFYQELGRVQQYVATVKDKNPTSTYQDILKSKDIDTYKDALVESYVVCERMTAKAEVIDKEVMKDYLDSVSRVRDFCTDYEDVSDYAKRNSKATKQFLVFPGNSIAGRPNESDLSINNLIEICGYTITDLKKLSSSPVDDPGLEEMIVGMENLKKLAEETKQNPSEITRAKLSRETTKQQDNLVHARLYFWNTTIKIDSLDRSISRVRSEFAPHQ